MKVAVLGDGLLGTTVADVLGVAPTTRRNFDASNFYSFLKWFELYIPDVVINCIGITPHHRYAYILSEMTMVNSYFPNHLLRYPTRVVHISTDCVFSGIEGGYFEEYQTDAADTYGETKASGEPAFDSALTLRTSFVGLPDPKGRGLFAWASQQDHINGFQNVWWSGLTTLELAYRIKWFIDNGIFNGLVHLHGERVSKYDLLCRAKDVFGWKADIVPVDEPVSDRSLASLYPEYQTAKSLDQMLQEQKAYADRKGIK